MELAHYCMVAHAQRGDDSVLIPPNDESRSRNQNPLRDQKYCVGVSRDTSGPIDPPGQDNKRSLCAHASGQPPPLLSCVSLVILQMKSLANVHFDLLMMPGANLTPL